MTGEILPFGPMKEIRDRLDRLEQQSGSLPSGGGGGTSGDMEARVGRLEERLDKVGDRLGGVEVNLATLTERVAHLPGKGFIVTVVGTGLTLLGGLTIFGEQVRVLLGVAG